jgi:hypothetical protein
MAPIIRKNVVQPENPATVDPPITVDAHRVWSDRFGRVAIRCAQILLVLLLATVFVFALVQLKLVVIPLLIATIVASACAPLSVLAAYRRSRPRGPPSSQGSLCSAGLSR